MAHMKLKLLLQSFSFVVELRVPFSEIRMGQLKGTKSSVWLSCVVQFELAVLLIVEFLNDSADPLCSHLGNCWELFAVCWLRKLNHDEFAVPIVFFIQFKNGLRQGAGA